MKFNYKFKEDIESVLEVKAISVEFFCASSGIPERTMFYSFSHTPSQTVLNKSYSYIYKLGIRLNKIKTELFEETKNKNDLILYHGSKLGIDELKKDGSRSDCDFGSGFYLTTSLDSATSFVNSYVNSSVYAFSIDLTDLNVYTFECDLDWMLLISLYRNKINQYKEHELITRILKKIENADVIVGPIADNKMFEVLSQFSSGKITTVEAIHALSASRLGKQYVIKSEKALNELVFLDRLYLCDEEKHKSLIESKEQELLIQTKLDYAKRNFRGKGFYIDEVLK